MNSMMKETKKCTGRNTYSPPCIKVLAEVLADVSLLSHSLDERAPYGTTTTDPFSQGDVNGRSGYGEGGDPFSQGGSTGSRKSYDIW